MSELAKSEEVSVVDLQKKAASLPKDDPFRLLFGNGNNYALDKNLGHGSFSGVNVRDLSANTVKLDEKNLERTDNVLKVEEAPQVVLPLIRYINLPGGSIEIKIYESSKPGWPNLGPIDKKYTANRTTDGIRFTKICEKVTLEELIIAISSRAMGWLEQTIESAKPAYEQPKLETSIEDEVMNERSYSVGEEGTCGEMVSMHERDTTNDQPCVLPKNHIGDCSPTALDKEETDL